jgi:hypothetical protein
MYASSPYNLFHAEFLVKKRLQFLLLLLAEVMVQRLALLAPLSATLFLIRPWIAFNANKRGGSGASAAPALASGR